MIDPLLLAFIELTLVMVLIMLLHSVRRWIGSPAFYLSVGLFLVLGQIVSAFGIRIDPGIGGFQLDVGNVIFTSPFLVALLIIYTHDGTLEAQQVILGFLALLIGYVCLTQLLSAQFALPGYTSRQPELFDHLRTSFSHGRRVVKATFVASAVDLFVLPILYQFFQNIRCRLFISVLGTLVFAQVIDSFLFQLVLAPQLGNWWEALRASYLARAGAMVWLSIMASLYLHMSRSETRQMNRPSLDIVFAFLGAHRRAEILRRNLLEWEGRYSTVVENTSDWIFVVTSEGVLESANAAARNYLGQIAGQNVSATDVFRAEEGEPIRWNDVWDSLCQKEEEVPASSHCTLRREWLTEFYVGEGATRLPLRLDVQVSPAAIDENPVAICVARDITEQRRLEEEQEALRQHFAMIQRLESVGVLAGGIAHDFNNLLHAMQAALERFCKVHTLSEGTRSLIRSLEDPLERASQLTSHLLGFARRGKYNPERLLLQDLLDEVEALFQPLIAEKIAFRRVEVPEAIYLRADRAQLEQVFLNMLINARDAIQDSCSVGGRIVLRAELASEHTPGWQVRPREYVEQEHPPERFGCIRVRDNGDGIPDEVRETLFEPFVTTKEVGQGTGMGLAMAYGCVSHHGGWIHYETSSEGTEFLAFLPCSK